MTINLIAMRILKENKRILTNQQYKTLKGQIISGNDEAALKGLYHIIFRE